MFGTDSLYNEYQESRDAEYFGPGEDGHLLLPRVEEWDGCSCSSCTGEEDFPPDPADEDWGPED